MAVEKLSKFISEYSKKNKENLPYPVYSVTNSSGFCTGYFDKDVSSNDKKNYKIVPYGCFAYNPSRINVGSIDWQHCEENVIVSPLYVVFKCSEKLFQPYLLYFLKSDVGHHLIVSNVSGSVRFNLKFKTLSEFEISVPSLEKQKEIVHKLDTIRNGIILSEKRLTLFDELVYSYFIEMFGDLDENPNKYPVKQLKEIADYWNGLTYKPSDVVDENEGTLVLRSSNIQNGKLAFDDNVFVNCDIKQKNYVKENDILMCSRNGSAKLVGKVALIKGIKQPTAFGAFMMIIRSKYYPYLKVFFETKWFRDQLSTGTSTVNQITGGMLDEVVLPVPSIEEISKFKAFIDKLNEAKEKTESRLNSLRELLEKMTTKYFEDESNA